MRGNIERGEAEILGGRKERTWVPGEEKWSCLIMLPSMMNMEKVRNPATTCRGSTAIWAEPEPRRPGEWEWKQGARGGEWSGVGWGRGEEGRSGATTTDREGG
jgi:hypothetical protein